MIAVRLVDVLERMEKDGHSAETAVLRSWLKTGDLGVTSKDLGMPFPEVNTWLKRAILIALPHAYAKLDHTRI